MKKLVLYLISAIFLVACSENYSRGERVGTVVQFSKTGLIWDSWEGQLNLTQTGMNTSGEPFNFSFDNDKESKKDSLMINLVNEAQAKGWKIKLVYHEVFGWNWFHNRGQTNHFVDSVIVLDKKFSKPLENRKPEIPKRDTLYVVIVNK